jgi:hypothetical protein
LAWLGDFLNRDVAADSSQTAGAEELRAFLMQHYQAWGGGVNFVIDAGLDQPIDPADVPAIQAAIRDALDRFASEGHVWFPHPIGDGLLWRRGRGVSLVTRAAGLAQVLAAVVDLLMTVGPRLQRCESCRRLFVMTRPHQRFCTTQCGTRQRVADWRDKNRDRLAESKHRQYARKVKEKLPHVRVTRRRKGTSQ